MHRHCTMEVQYKTEYRPVKYYDSDSSQRRSQLGPQKKRKISKDKSKFLPKQLFSPKCNFDFSYEEELAAALQRKGPLSSTPGSRNPSLSFAEYCEMKILRTHETISPVKGYTSVFYPNRKETHYLYESDYCEKLYISDDDNMDSTPSLSSSENIYFPVETNLSGYSDEDVYFVKHLRLSPAVSDDVSKEDEKLQSDEMETDSLMRISALSKASLETDSLDLPQQCASSFSEDSLELRF